MKRFYVLVIGILLLLSLAACAGTSPALSRQNCSKDREICVELQAEEPISFGGQVTASIIVTSKEDVSDLGVYLTSMPPNMLIVQETTIIEPGIVSRKAHSGVNWLVDIKSNQPVVFTRDLKLPAEEGRYRIDAYAMVPGGKLAQTYLTIVMTREGGKIYLPGTPIPTHEGPDVATLNPDQLATVQAQLTTSPYPTEVVATSAPAISTTMAPPPEILSTTAYPPPYP